jgi:hypothetical protein
MPQSTSGRVEYMHSLPERFAPGNYANYRSAAQSWWYMHSKDKDFAECMGAFTVANVSPTDLALFDRYARGEIAMPRADIERADAYVNAKLQAAPNYREALRPYCPDKVDDFRWLD